MEALEQEITAGGILCDIPHFCQVVHPNPPKRAATVGKTLTADASGAREQREFSSLSEEIAYLKATSFVSAYRPIYSCRRFWGPIIVFCKRVIRKLTKFYVEPIALDQSDRNAHMANALALMQQRIEALTAEVERLKNLKT